MPSENVYIYIQTKGRFREVYPQRVAVPIELEKSKLDNGWNCAVFGLKSATLTKEGMKEINVDIPCNGSASEAIDYEKFSALVAPLIHPSTLLIINS